MCSQAVRAISKAVLAAVASASPHRALVLLDLLAGMLALAAAEHGHSAELFSLITQLIKDESARLYLAARGFLPVKIQPKKITKQPLSRNEARSEGLPAGSNVRALLAKITQHHRRAR